MIMRETVNYIERQTMFNTWWARSCECLAAHNMYSLTNPSASYRVACTSWGMYNKMVSGGEHWSTLIAYCAVRGWGGYCWEKYAMAWTGVTAAQHNRCVNSGISSLMFFSVTRYWARKRKKFETLCKGRTTSQLLQGRNCVEGLPIKDDCNL